MHWRTMLEKETGLVDIVEAQIVVPDLKAICFNTELFVDESWLIEHKYCFKQIVAGSSRTWEPCHCGDLLYHLPVSSMQSCLNYNG